MKNNIKFVRVICIVNLFFVALLCPVYARAEIVAVDVTTSQAVTVPESVPNVHFFLESFNSLSWIWFFRSVFIIGVLIALVSYLYFLHYKNKQQEEENELFNTLGKDFTIQEEGRKE